MIASLSVANGRLLILNLPLIGLGSGCSRSRDRGSTGGILVFATPGTFGANPSLFEHGALLALGLLGFGLRVFGYPIAPVVIGLILGPMAEVQLRRALAISQNDWTVLVTSPISATLLAIAALAVILPIVLKTREKGITFGEDD